MDQILAKAKKQYNDDKNKTIKLATAPQDFPVIQNLKQKKKPVASIAAPRL